MPEFRIGNDVMCVDDSPLLNPPHDPSGLKAYTIYRIAGIFPGGKGIYLGGIQERAFNLDRFVDVNDWTEEQKAPNRT